MPLGSEPGWAACWCLDGFAVAINPPLETLSTFTSSTKPLGICLPVSSSSLNLALIRKPWCPVSNSLCWTFSLVVHCPLTLNTCKINSFWAANLLFQALRWPELPPFPATRPYPSVSFLPPATVTESHSCFLHTVPCSCPSFLFLGCHAG